MGHLSKRILERSIKGFGLWLRNLGEGLSFSINWVLLGSKGNSIIGYFK